MDHINLGDHRISAYGNESDEYYYLGIQIPNAVIGFMGSRKDVTALVNFLRKTWGRE
jgi:hypothetical protein